MVLSQNLSVFDTFTAFGDATPLCCEKSPVKYEKNHSSFIMSLFPKVSLLQIEQHNISVDFAPDSKQ